MATFGIRPDQLPSGHPLYKAWQARRKRYFATHAQVCAHCGSRRRIVLHHLRYSNLGQEPDEDLMPLCERHHAVVHQFARRHWRLSLRYATHAALDKTSRDRLPEPRPKPLLQERARTIAEEWAVKHPETGVGGARVT